MIVAIDVLEAGAKPEEINETFDGLRTHIAGDDVDFVVVAVPALKGVELAQSLASLLGMRPSSPSAPAPAKAAA